MIKSISLLVICFPKTRSYTMQIAVEKFSEATVGHRGNRKIAEKWVQLFSTPYFIVTAVSAVHTLFS